MHNMLFILIWPLAAVCAFLPRSRFVVGLAVFLICQCLLWYTTMTAMSAPDWDESAGDWLVPLVISLPVPAFVALILLRLSVRIAQRLLSKYLLWASEGAGLRFD